MVCWAKHHFKLMPESLAPKTKTCILWINCIAIIKIESLASERGETELELMLCSNLNCCQTGKQKTSMDFTVDTDSSSVQ